MPQYNMKKQYTWHVLPFCYSGVCQYTPYIAEDAVKHSAFLCLMKPWPIRDWLIRGLKILSCQKVQCSIPCNSSLIVTNNSDCSDMGAVMSKRSFPYDLFFILWNFCPSSLLSQVNALWHIFWTLLYAVHSLFVLLYLSCVRKPSWKVHFCVETKTCPYSSNKYIAYSFSMLVVSL